MNTERQKTTRPIRGHIYTLLEVLTNLDLQDHPHLCFTHQGRDCVIQTSHVPDDELLGIPLIADTQWKYMYTTHEWIPIFANVDATPPLSDFLDIEREIERDGTYGADFWCCPKSFPRSQYYKLGVGTNE